VGDYIAGVGGEVEAMSARDVALERLLMGLRTDEGVARADVAPLGITDEKLAVLDGFVVADAGRLRVTRKGRPVLDYLLAELAG